MQATKQNNDRKADHMLYSNIDINSSVTPYLNHMAEKADLKREDLYPFVDIFSKTPVTDLILNIFCQYSAASSEVWTDYEDKYLVESEDGISVNYKKLYEGIYRINTGRGIDPYEVWFRRIRENGMRAWASIRMNDAHCPELEVSFLRSDFINEACRKGWNLGEEYGYFHRCLNYAVPEVRGRMLAYIAEQMERYDVDGLELDFQREMYCFDYLHDPDCAGIMTQFVRDVRTITRKAEQRLGHPVLLGVRLQRDIGQNLMYGMDVLTWDSEKLVDVVVVTPRWASCDSGMPIAEWKQRIKNASVCAGLEVLLLRQCDKGYITQAQAAGYTLQYLSEGADAMYLFNQFFDLSPLNPDALTSENFFVSRRCADTRSAASEPFRNVMAYQDIAPREEMCWRPLPLELNGEPRTLSMDLGTVPDGRRVSVVLGFSRGTEEDTDIMVNGCPVTEWEPAFFSKAEPQRAFDHAEPGAYLVRAEISVPKDAKVTLSLTAHAGKALALTYFETEVY